MFFKLIFDQILQTQKNVHCTGVRSDQSARQDENKPENTYLSV